MATLNSFTFYSKLGESREIHPTHCLSGFIIVLHCILLNLFVLNHNVYPFSAIKTKPNLYPFSGHKYNSQEELKKKQKLKQGKAHGSKREINHFFLCIKNFLFKSIRSNTLKSFFIHKAIIIKGRKSRLITDVESVYTECVIEGDKGWQ